MELMQSIEMYKNATEEFISVAQGLTDSELDKLQTDSWTARQVIHHVADSEAQSYARLRRLIAEPGTVIQGYNEAVWGENQTLGYEELPIENSLAVFVAVRASSLEILKRLTTSQLQNSGIHSESGEYTINTWLETYINHPLEHAQQIRSSL
ncbi:MAG: DinB family protein [Candidatus Planktophila sp.]